MRVISGTARGLRLRPVAGTRTRPTTDRVKENIFNLIQDAVYGATALDLFAGTGQLGVEALSRGAAHCDFVEHTKAACQTIRANIAAAHLEQRAALHQTEATQFLQNAKKNFYDLIFLDPPYGGEILERALLFTERFDILATNGIIICECARDDNFSHNFTPLRVRTYGATVITLLQRREHRLDTEISTTGIGLGNKPIVD